MDDYDDGAPYLMCRITKTVGVDVEKYGEGEGARMKGSTTEIHAAQRER